MSLAIWGTSEYEINPEVIKSTCPQEYDRFVISLDATGNDFDSYCKYFQNNDTMYLEEEDESLMQNTNDRFVDVQNAFMDKTKVELGLFAALGDVTYGEDRGYWTVDNALIWNPEIDVSIRTELTQVDVIQAG